MPQGSGQARWKETVARGEDGDDARMELLLALAVVASVALVYAAEVRSVPLAGLLPYLVAVLAGFVALGRFEGSPYGSVGTLVGLLGTPHFLIRENDCLLALMLGGCFFSLFLAVALVLRIALRCARRLVLRIIELHGRP